jgi:PAS domain S-box-containing protein
VLGFTQFPQGPNALGGPTDRSMESHTANESQAGKIARLLRSRSPALGYAVALLLCGLAAGIDFAFPGFSARFPLLAFFLATSLAAWLGGFAAGVLACIVSILVADYYFIPPPGFTHDPITMVKLGVAGLIIVVISWLIDNRTRAQQSIAAGQARAAGQERRLQAMLSSAARIAGMGSWEHDIANDRLEWDDETIRIFGITREAFGGNAAAFFALVHPDDREALRAMQVKARPSHGVTEMEYRIVRPDGAVRNIHDRGQVTRDEGGRPVQSTGMVLDVTERRQAEGSLRVQAHILDNIGQAVIATDIEARITYANRHAGEVYGWSVSEMLGRTPWRLWSRNPAVNRRRESWRGCTTERTGVENSSPSAVTEACSRHSLRVLP